ncbi:unnamed protein product [Coregonus sp. 'balchen']|nr:unnamed protein product [Coregonus sp. 'balchen']
MASYHKPDEKTLQGLKDIANKLRINSVKATCASNSGHPTTCCSAAELMSVLFFHTMRYKATDPRNQCNDRFVLSKGHAAPILYAAWAEAGFVKEADLINLRKIDSDLEGHPTPKLEFVDVATGSLGQGLGAASMAFGSYYDLDNLVAIIDANRLGQSEAAPLKHDMDVYRRRCEAFGWNTYVVDGHDVEELCKALWQAQQVKGKPTMIIAKTFKGRGLKGIENMDNWHGKPMPKDRAEEAIKDLEAQIQNPNKTICPELPNEDTAPADLSPITLPSPPNYKIGDKVATRKAYGVALAKLGQSSPRVVALDADMKNSTFSEMFHKAYPERFIECFIAEQNMVSVAIGCATRDRTVAFASTFAAFLSRAYDHIRMAAVSESNINLAGDGVSTERSVELAANTKGICFIRLTRPELKVVYDPKEKFEVGVAKVLRVNIRVIDPFTIKPLDAATIVSSARATGGRIITVEDHYREGGLGEAVLSAVGEEPGIMVTRLAVNRIPRSGKPQELLDLYGISAKHIANAVRQTFAN